MAEKPELLMPVSHSDAALQFFVEAMKANTAVLHGLQDEQKETLRSLTGVNDALHSIDIRLTRIESNSVNADVATLKADVEKLKAGEARREGASALASGTIRNAPTIILIVGFIATLFIILAANGKLP